MYNKLCSFYKGLLVMSIFTSVLVSCKSTFDLKPEDALEEEQTYRNVYDADAVVNGIYGKLLGLAERYVLLNELRADLLEATPTSNTFIKQLSTNSLSPDNPYTDPRPFYEVIINCNDALNNFTKMHDKLLLSNQEYYQRFADVACLRGWLYLQLGIHYGRVPYITEPLDKASDVRDQTKFERIPFNSLLDSLISFTESIPKEYLEQNTSASSPTLLVPTNGYILKDGVFKFYIHRKSFLGDLHLWKGNYLQAAGYYKEVLETATKFSTTTDFNIDVYDTYRITDDRTPEHNLFVTSTNPWKNIFSNTLAEPITNRERIWTLPFDANYSPKNPFINIFSVSGGYLARPSAQSIKNWDSQVRTGDVLTDLRGLNSSYRINGDKSEVLKYLATYNPSLPFATNGVWILYRAAIIHLRYAEAVNQLNKTKLVRAIVNNGFLTTYSGKSTGESFPFDFDATDESTRKGSWHRSKGIRGRAVLKDQTFTDGDILGNEEKILDEEALETAFEGYRWPDLLRITLRRGNLDYINEKLKAKTGSSKTFKSMSDLYLPFK